MHYQIDKYVPVFLCPISFSGFKPNQLFFLPLGDIENLDLTIILLPIGNVFQTLLSFRTQKEKIIGKK